MFKKTGFVLAVLMSLVFVFPFAVSASMNDVSLLDLNISKTSFSPGETIAGTFTAKNSGDSVIGDLTYNIELLSGKEVGGLLASVDKKYDLKQSGVLFTLAGKEEAKKDFSYTLPANLPNGSMFLSLRLTTGRGERLAWIERKIEIKGSGKYLSIGDMSILLKDGSSVTAAEGINIDGGDETKIKFDIENLSPSEVKALPKIITYKRNASSGNIAKEENGNEINLKPSEKQTVVFTLPALTESESYYTEVRYYDAQNQNPISNIVYFRWVVKGADNAKVISAALDKTTYQAGDTATATVLVSGPAAYTGESEILSKGVLSLKIINSKGNAIGEAKQDINIAPQTVVLKIPIKEYIANPKLEAEILKGDKAIDSYSFQLNSDKTDPKKIGLAGIISLIVLFIVIAAVIIIVVLKIKKKNSSGIGGGNALPLILLVVLFVAFGFAVKISADVLIDDSGNHAGCGSSPGYSDATSITTRITDTSGNVISGIDPGKTFCFQAEASALNCADGLFFNKLRIFLGANDDSVHGSLVNPAGYAGTQCMGAQSCVNDSNPNCCSSWQANNEFMPNPPPGASCAGDSCTRTFLGGTYTYQNANCFDKLKILNESQPQSQLSLISSANQPIGSSADGSFYFIDELNSSDSSRMTACIPANSLPKNVRGWVRIYYEYSGIHGKYFKDNKHWHWHIAYLPIYVYKEPEVKNISFTSDYCESGVGNGKITTSWLYYSNDNKPQAKYKLRLMPGGFTVYDYIIDKPLPNNQSENFSLNIGQTENLNSGGAPNFLPTLAYNKTYFLSVSVQDTSGNWSELVSVPGGGGIYTAKNPYPVNKISFNPSTPKVGQQVNFTSTAQFFDTTCKDNPNSSNCLYNWTFESGSPSVSALRAPNVSFTSSGSKAITMAATDSNGYFCPAKSWPVSVDSAPAGSPPVAAISCSTANCEVVKGAAIRLINNSVDPDGQGDIAKSEWFIKQSDGSYSSVLICASGQVLCDYNPQTGTTGNYTAKLVITDKDGNVSNPAYRDFFVVEPSQNQPPSADFACVDKNGNPMVPNCVGPKDNFILANTSVDPDGEGDIASSTWYIDNVARLLCDKTNKPILCDYDISDFPGITSGEHRAKLCVKDSENNNVCAEKYFTIQEENPNAPVAAIDCSTGNCVVNKNSTLTLINKSTDADGQGDIAKSEWFMKQTDGSYSSVKVCASGQILCDYNPATGTVGTYTAKLVITDKESHVSAPAFKEFTVSLNSADKPSAMIMCDYENCTVKQGSSLRLHNRSSDPNGNDNISISIWYLRDAAGVYKVVKIYMNNDVFLDYMPPTLELGTYSAKLVVKDKESNTSDPAYMEFKVIKTNKAPTADISCVPPSCEVNQGEDIVLKNASTDPDGQSDIVFSRWIIDNWKDTIACGKTTLNPVFCDYTPTGPTATTGSHTAQLLIEDNGGHSVWSAVKEYRIVNPSNPPDAKISCSPSNCSQFLGDPIILKNDSTDSDSTNPPANNNDINRSQWFVKKGSAGAYNRVLDCGIGNPVCSYTPQPTQIDSAGEWYAKLIVTDKGGLDDSAEQRVEIKEKTTAGFLCSLHDAGPWFTCDQNFTALEEKPVYFTDDETVLTSDGKKEFSFAANGASITARKWVKGLSGLDIFSSGNSTKPSFVVKASDILSDTITISLIVTDSNGIGAVKIHTIGAAAKYSPKWWEIAPF